MILVKFGILALVCFGASFADNSACGDWEPYKDEKCFKILKTAGLQSFEEAEKSCVQNDSSSHLISITFLEEQDFLTNFLFTKNKVVDNVWIGAKYAGSKFQWEDKSDLTFTNWAAGSPKNHSDYCVQMEADEKLVGKWFDEPCAKKNLVVCQKPQTWSIAKLQKTLLDIRKQHQDELDEVNRKLASANHEIQSLTTSKKNLQDQLDVVKNNPVPIGFIYAQLPNEKSPKEIWSWMSWTDVSSNYKNVFFRVEGDATAPFGQVQDDNAPSITNVNTGYEDEAGVTPREWVHMTVPKCGTSPWIYTGASKGNNRYTRFEISCGEVRPKNMAIRVWKRTR